MKKTVWKAYMDYEKEEKWLNEMSAKGLAFTDYFFLRYLFEDCKPGEYVYRIELLDNLTSSAESRRYLDFMAENGVEHVATWIRWVYFRKKAESGAFDIYSDIDSRIKHYKRIFALWLPLMIVELLCGVAEVLFSVNYLHGGFEIIASQNLVVGIILLCIGVAIFIHWNDVRLKIKKLKADKQLRE